MGHTFVKSASILPGGRDSLQAFRPSDNYTLDGVEPSRERGLLSACPR